MTSLKSAMPEASHLDLLAIDGGLMTEAIRTYLANPIFQAARYEELLPGAPTTTPTGGRYAPATSR